MKRNPVAWAALIVATAALVSSSGFLRPMPAAPKAPLEGQQAARALSEAYEAVAEFVRPSVVQITVQKKAGNITQIPGLPGLRPFPGQPRGNGNMNPRDLEDMIRRFLNPDGNNDENGKGPQKEQFGRMNVGVGSGFIYDDRGHILTNNHVVDNAEKITVTFYDGVESSAKVVGADKQTDVAVIQVENTSYQALPRGDSARLKVGELVMAIGSPFELSQSVTTGIVSALDRNNLGINGATGYESFIQTDTPINRGNSGGPLVNMNGEVVGINSAILSGGSGNDGIGFAIPMKLAHSIAEMLIKDGKVHYARIGIQLQALDPRLTRQFGIKAGTKGVLVGDVVPGSPADEAGLKQGDVITSFAGEPIHDAASFRLRVATSEVNRSYEMGYLRDGNSRTAKIVPAPAENIHFAIEGDSGQGPSAEKAEPEKTAIGAFGLEVQPLTSDLAKSLGLAAETKGLVVSSVKEGSPAAEAGVREGDVITKVVRDHRIQTVKGVEDLQAIASKDTELALYVMTGKAGRFVTLSKAPK